MSDDIEIDEELRTLIPPLSDEELRQLEANIVEYGGARDALVVWESDARRVMLDGHNRLDICRRHDLPFTTVGVRLPDLDAAKNWIRRNQLGRRNLAPDVYSLLRGQVYNAEKNTQGGARFSSDQNDHLKSESTAERLASEFGVSAPTIRRDGAFAEAVA